MARLYTFWNLLSEKKIVIPIIQRDYAQGRKDKSYVRKGFLEQLGKALDIISCKDINDKIAELDFVYGTEYRIKQQKGREQIELFPLDGQQRLTTLWLLHWYVAFKSENLIQDDVKNTLLNFSYETRTSSREFCESLCNIKLNKDVTDIKEYIIQQTWFYAAWNQDPTIQAMLRMLEGTDTSNEKDGEYLDGIQELFSGVSNYEPYWNVLIRDNCPIRFTFLPLQSSELPASDDLYIKMNARGKALTDFENFKSDLVDWIYQEKNDNIFGENNDAQRNRRAELASLIDNQWTDVFWSVDKMIDDTYFAFLNRYFLNQAIIYGFVKSNQNKIVEGSNLWTLYGDSSDDSNIEYRGFSIYATIMDKIIDLTTSDHIDILTRLQKLFNHFNKNGIKQYLPLWAQRTYRNFEFIPVHTKDGLSTLTQPQRVLFHAICRYFEVTEFDECSFRRWMRIACNLIENPSIGTIDAMIGRLKLIDELSIHCNDIYRNLADTTTQIKSDAASDQVTEERSKAKQMLIPEHDTILSDEPRGWKDKEVNKGQEWNWETAIIESENYAFFHGAIRFLYINGQGIVNWNDFKVKTKNALTYFEDNGVKDSVKHAVISGLIKLIPNWSLMYDIQIFTKEASFWKRFILYNNNYFSPIHNLLIINDLQSITYTDMAAGNEHEEYNNIRKQLCDSGLLNIIIDHHDEFRFRWNGPLAMYRPHGGQGEPIVFDFGSHQRNEFLNKIIKNIKEIKVHKQIPHTNPIFFYGWSVPLTYSAKNGREYTFYWQHSNWIDMYDGNIKCWDKKDQVHNELRNKYKRLHTHYPNEEAWEPKLFFNDEKSFVKELDRCVSEYELIKEIESKN
jgi:hypothetical protein